MLSLLRQPGGLLAVQRGRDKGGVRTGQGGRSDQGGKKGGGGGKKGPGNQGGNKKTEVTEEVVRHVTGDRTIGNWRHDQNRAHWAGYFNGLATAGCTVSFAGHTNTVRVSPHPGYWCYLDQEGGELEEFPANQMSGRTTGACAILTDYDVVEKTIRGVKTTIYRPTNTYLGARDTSRTHTYTAH